DATAFDQTLSDKFRVDASGQLVLDGQTRLHVEALVALTDLNQLDAKIEEEVGEFPPAARARAHDLVERYRVYIIAQKQTYPPGIAPDNEDEMATQLDGLHVLRVAHFGQATADAFYADEEKLDRELLDLMRLEKDPGLTMEEKAERAQARYTKLHLAAKYN
ncbi:MAG TPA: lipase secretion chaperone, partial [Steroidobacteraceae bacterium]|nr:lipase secretion chaperone [Steroidobacteraceae bacterium]